MQGGATVFTEHYLMYGVGTNTRGEVLRPPPPAVAAHRAAQRRWSRGNKCPLDPHDPSHGQRTCPAC
eukprot:5106870-Prymnesium_polylepis.1